MKINLKKIKDLKKIRFLQKTPLFIARHQAYSGLLLFLIALFIGFIIMQKYTYFDLNQAGGNSNSLFREDLYKKILEIQKNQSSIFQGVGTSDYKNPFQEIK